jgi:uracil-DNA glycosylase
MHPIEQLRQSFDFLDPHAAMRPIPKWIAGRAFFPGGAGLFTATRNNPLPPMPARSVMLVGHNFDSEESYRESLARGEESISGGTWRQLLSVLRDAHVSPEECFFTNAIMGLMPRGVSVGTSPGFRDHSLSARCAQFLQLQIAVVKPRAVVTLGLEAFHIYRDALSAPAARTPTVDWPTIDANRSQYSEKQVLGEGEFRFAALVHPSYRHLNMRNRRFEDLVGNAAEIELLRRASAASR